MLLLIVGAVFVGLVEGTSYEGYKVYHVTPKTWHQSRVLESYRMKANFDFWAESKALGEASHIMVGPDDKTVFEAELDKHDFDFHHLVSDVQRLIEERRREDDLSRSILSPGQISFGSYLFYGEQVAYIHRLASDYPDIVTVDTLGQSYEGRDILIVRISSGDSNEIIPKPVIFIDAGIHCREWIAPPVALYIIQQLVENQANSWLIENVTWYVVPNLNPDGYEYTQTHDRLWRKNRRHTEGAECTGTDLNRNFGYQWMVAGASNYSCDQTYAGPEAFSEPEARAIRDWFLSHSDENVKLYLTFHSYGEMILYPWGYSSTTLPDDADHLHYVGDLAAIAIDQSSTINSRYQGRVNSSGIFLYAAAGGSDDWVKAVAGVDLSYCVELPNGEGPYHFMLPARQIFPAVQETFEGVKAFHDYIEKTYWTDLLESK